VTVEQIYKVAGGWKTGAGIVGGFVTAVLLFVGAVKAPQAAIDFRQDQRIHALESSLDTIRYDLRKQGNAAELMQCWIRHQIHGTDASECLVLNGESTD